MLGYIIVVILVLIFIAIYIDKKENLVTFNNTVFEPLPSGIVEGGIYTDGVFYYLVQRDPNDNDNYQKRIISGKDAGLLNTPSFKGTNKNIGLLRDGLPINLTENTVISRTDGRIGKIVGGEFKQWTHGDSYRKGGTPPPSENNYDIDKLQYVLPNNIYTYGLMAGPTWMIDSNKF